MYISVHFKEGKRKPDENLPEAAEWYLLKQQISVLPQVEALENDIGANDLLDINKAKVKNVKHKVSRCRILEAKYIYFNLNIYIIFNVRNINKLQDMIVL